MQVNVYSADGATLEQRNATLLDVMGDELNEVYWDVVRELCWYGRALVGGGAGVLFLLTICRD